MGLLVFGVLALLALGASATLLLPVSDPANSARARGEPRNYSPVALEGRQVYFREGCAYCHTQLVRDTLADSYLGPTPSQPGEYLGAVPVLAGAERVGPDLSCVGDRFEKEDDILAFLKNPRDPAFRRAASIMPSYSWLPGTELQALASYLKSLSCRK